MAIISLLASCSPDVKEEKTIQSMKTNNQRVVLYQMMTRLFGNTNTTNKPWGTLDENGVGKFNDINDAALQDLKDMGYTHVWYTGAIEHAVLTDYTQFDIPLDDADVVKGRAGSPYAIKDYYDVNPDLAIDVPNRIKEFEQLIKRTQGKGLKVVIDFVPNHVARGYQSDAKPAGVVDFGADDDTSKNFDPANNFYYLNGADFEVPEGYNSLGEDEFPTKNGKFAESPAKVSGNDVFSPTPSVNDWFETIKLNYGLDYQNDRTRYFDPIPDTWLKVKEILTYWAEKGVDGFRCDMAEMVPVEFWHWITNEMKQQFPEIIFIAEIYNPNAYRDYLFTGGFDYLYDKVEMYDTLKHIIQGRATTDDITTIWQRQEGISDYMLRFLENHDEQRIASPDFAGDMWKGLPMMAATTFMHKGPVMMYFGQDIGEPGAGYSGFASDDGRTTIFDYWSVPEHVKFINEGKYDGGLLSKDQKALKEQYRQILRAANSEPAIKEGAFFDLHYFNRNDQYTGYSNSIYSFLRHHDGQALLFVINFSTEQEQVKIKIPKEAWEAMGISSDNLQFIRGNLSQYAVERSSLMDYSVPSQLEINARPLNCVVLEIKADKR
ncbi:MAG: alpha amylase C-terminal domain-containing protein [Cyclobacteriaceae bacterium]